MKFSVAMKQQHVGRYFMIHVRVTRKKIAFCDRISKILVNQIGWVK